VLEVKRPLGVTVAVRCGTAGDAADRTAPERVEEQVPGKADSVGASMAVVVVVVILVVVVVVVILVVVVVVGV
jgi:hypothetical protein